MLWWQSIYQDDPEVKGKGVRSLIKYTTRCSYMLVPTEEEELTGDAAGYPEDIPVYGSRGWVSAYAHVNICWASLPARVPSNLGASISNTSYGNRDPRSRVELVLSSSHLHRHRQSLDTR